MSSSAGEAGAEDGTLESRPFLRRVASSSGGGGSSRRRLSATSPAAVSRRNSFRREIFGGRLQMDHKVSCSCLLCNIAYARISAGYKAWGALLGRRLSERGVIVACIDYRNFPQGTISDMVNDASEGISFVCNNIASFGGDPNRIYLVGQSAGAHIAACTLLDQAVKECGEGESTTWSVSQINAYFGISGGYNMLNLVDHFHRRGLYRSIFLSIMEGEEGLKQFSPEIVVQDLRSKHAASLLPQIILFHGTNDYSIPLDESKTFVDALESVGVQVKLVLYEGKTHTDLFLQDPLRGGRDELLEDIVTVIHTGDAVSTAKDAVDPPARRHVPEIMLQLARRISPF